MYTCICLPHDQLKEFPFIIFIQYEAQLILYQNLQTVMVRIV